MATASGAQREPSMEEILASIRRIIEDSDGGRKPADDLKQDLEPASAEKSVDAFRAELRAEPARRPTLAEVQAQLSSVEPAVQPAEPQAVLAPALPAKAAEAAEKPAAAEFSPPAKASEPAEAIVADWRRDIAAAAQPENPRPSLSTPLARHEDVPVIQPVRDEVRLEAVEAALPAIADQPAEDDETELDISEDELVTGVLDIEAEATRQGATPFPPEPQLNRPAIVSDHVGRQVAAAFGELSEAFAARSKKSVDEMAEDMLRPMLQDWLDNNLPTLVERLVREEIERVARGAQ